MQLAIVTTIVTQPYKMKSKFTPFDAPKWRDDEFIYTFIILLDVGHAIG